MQPPNELKTQMHHFHSFPFISMFFPETDRKHDRSAKILVIFLFLSGLRSVACPVAEPVGSGFGERRVAPDQRKHLLARARGTAARSIAVGQIFEVNPDSYSILSHMMLWSAIFCSI